MAFAMQIDIDEGLARIGMSREDFDALVKKTAADLWVLVYRHTPTTAAYPVYQDWAATDAVGRDEYEGDIEQMLAKMLLQLP